MICLQVAKKVRPRFHLVRRCARSDVRVVITANFSSLWRCSEFALFKRGLALNFGWVKGAFCCFWHFWPLPHYNDFLLAGGLGHCEVLECPEHDTLASLRRRENYDYYSLYANPLREWLTVLQVMSKGGHKWLAIRCIRYINPVPLLYVQKLS